MVVSVLLMWAVVPLAPTVVGTDINVGALYIVAVGAFGVLATILAGWSSNNKFALLGAFRAVAQLISYEIPLVIALMVPVLLARTMGIVGIVEAQTPWFVFVAPLAALILLITFMAEVGKAPFDLLEGESEIVAGYHTEYSGMKFGMFYVGEFLHQFTAGALLASLFFGGWRGPGAEQWPVLGVFYFYLKTFILYIVITWIRLTLPRIRIDQLLNLGWKFFTPFSLVLLMITAILDKSLEVAGVERLGFVYSIVMLAANVLIAWVTVQILRRSESPIQRQRFEPRPLAVSPKTPVQEETGS
jgi:NADH-quinone oxidoreductase subunit H